MAATDALIRIRQTYPRAGFWLKAGIRFGSVQLLVQGLSVLSGLLLVRCLAKEQYAWLTIVGAMQGTLAILADNGVGMALLAEGGKVCQDRPALSRLISSAVAVRRWLAAGATLIVVPALFLMLRKAEAPPLIAALLITGVLAGFYFGLHAGTLNVVPRLLGQVDRLQNLDLFPTVGRVLLLALLAVTHWLSAVTATIAASLGSLAQFLLLRLWTGHDIDRSAPPAAAERAAILAVVKRVTPNTLFYCLQGQLSILLIAVFATSDNVAEVGALGRLAIIFSVISSVMGNIVIPAFARCQDRGKLLRTYFLVTGGFLALCLALFGVAWLFPNQILWVLGKSYAHLQHELLLMVALTLSGAFVGTMFSLNAARAWMDVAWMEIPLRIALQIILLLCLDIRSVSGVLWLSILSNLSPLFINLILTLRGFARLPQLAA